MIVSLVSITLLLRSVFVAGDCLVRMHRFHDCKNTDDDVIADWSTAGEKEMFQYWIEGEGYSGWTRTREEGLWMAEKLEDWTSAFSFDGDCEKIEVFDEDAMPKQLWGPTIREDAIGYSHNCVVINGRLKDEKECFWACNTPNGCRGATKNCVNLRSDLNDDVGGFVATAVCKEGCSEPYWDPDYYYGDGMIEDETPVKSTLMKSTVWFGVALGISIVGVGVLVYRHRKTAAEYDDIDI